MLLKYFISGLVLIFCFAFGNATYSVNMDAQANQLIIQSLDALGGDEALNQLTGVTYHVPNIYRSRTLMESYSALRADTTIAVGGNQNISFSFASPELQQRIDRFFQTSGKEVVRSLSGESMLKVSEFWLVNNPTNLPISFSLVVEDGEDGFACYVQGNNYVFDPVTARGGYVDAALAEYLIHQSHAFSPKLMSTIKRNNVATSSTITLPGNIKMPAVYDRILDLTVILNPQTHLPYIIRSIEDHYIFGKSYHDLVVYNYTSVSGIQFPRRFKTMYNHDSLLEDFIVTDIDVNPKFAPEFFQGLNASQSPTPKTAPARISGYGHAEIGEYSFNRIWGGEYTGTLANLSATHPDPSLPNIWHLQFLDSPLWQQMVMEFEHGVIVVDAPPHQNQLVIKWVNDALKKPITHFWPTHHHHDHTYAAKEFVEIGAKIITPKVAVPHWSYIPGAQLEIFGNEPFVYKDDTLQARFHWSQEGVHSDDFTYATITKANPRCNDSMVIIEADAWSPGIVGFEFDQAEALDWVRQIVADGVARNGIVWPIHGSPTPLTELFELTGYEYPNYSVCDMMSGPPLC